MCVLNPKIMMLELIITSETNYKRSYGRMLTVNRWLKVRSIEEV